MWQQHGNHDVRHPMVDSMSLSFVDQSMLLLFGYCKHVIAGLQPCAQLLWQQLLCMQVGGCSSGGSSGMQSTPAVAVPAAVGPDMTHLPPPAIGSTIMLTPTQVKLSNALYTGVRLNAVATARAIHLRPIT